MFGSKLIVAAGVAAAGLAGATKAMAYDGVYGGYAAPTPAYTVPYVPAGYGAPVYSTPRCEVPAPVYYRPRPVAYCPPPAPVCPPVVVYRPYVAPCAPRVYTPYEWRQRNRVQVNFQYGGRW